jgi:hypothetical protein
MILAPEVASFVKARKKLTMLTRAQIQHVTCSSRWGHGPPLGAVDRVLFYFNLF